MTAKVPKPAKKTQSQLTDLKKQLNEITHALQTERADAINIRRRHEQELSGLKTRLKANIIRELLPVIDNLERSLRHVPKGLENNDYTKGIKGVVKQFESTLGQMGVNKIKTIGEEFNPKYHEAVSMDDSTEGNKEIVSEELQAGYTIEDEVIRHAMVKVKLQ